VSGWNTYPGTPSSEASEDDSFFGPKGLPPSMMRQQIRQLLATIGREYLHAFLRAVHGSLETKIPWPRGVLLQALAWQLQQGWAAQGARTLIRMPATPLRALTALSILPAWAGFDGESTARTLCVARTKTLAAAHRRLAVRALSTPLLRWSLEERRNGQLMMSPTSKIPRVPTPAALMGNTVWAARGDTAVKGAFDQIILVEPFPPEPTVADLKALLAWLKPLAGPKKAPASITIVADLLMSSPLIGALADQGFAHIDIPLRAFIPTTLSLAPSVTRTFKQGECLAPDHPSRYDLMRAREVHGPVNLETLWT